MWNLKFIATNIEKDPLRFIHYSINSFYNKYYTSHIIGKINTDNNLYMDNLKNILSGGRIERVKRSFISLVIGGYFCF